MLERLQAIEETLKSRVPDSSGGCSSRDFLEHAAKSSRQFRQSGLRAPPEKFTPQHKRKVAEVAESESDGDNIATDSTRTQQRKVLRAPRSLIRSFSRKQHSEIEIKAWMEDRANKIMDEAGAFACKKI
jgi:hypothetical protein